MDTHVRTPQDVFMQPQRLMVPLFQRAYVWNEEAQWEPLWEDLGRVAERIMTRPKDKPQPHFLGAVVLQALPRPIGTIAARTIIDGQQRLTTLQLLLDALHAELLRASVTQAAARLEPLVANPGQYCAGEEDRFKVWPTNRDRKAFNAVMAATPPIDYEAIGHQGARMVEAHRYFAERARAWLTGGNGDVAGRGAAIEIAAREHLQMVVIDLGVDEDAQEIFETLNARGTPLSSADLIKNFVFQRLADSEVDVEAAYKQMWSDFETGFWETEVSVGRLLSPRSAVFLNHWLIARTGEQIPAGKVFQRFKRFASDLESETPMPTMLAQIQRAAGVYRDFIKVATESKGDVDRLALFGYRTGVLESEVVKPLVLWLLDPGASPIPEAQLARALDAVESWMVRRMLVRATSKDYNHVVCELIGQLRRAPRETAGDVVQGYLAEQTSPSRYWPDDDEMRREIPSLLAYRRLARGRLRMVLEAIEDHLRGWKDGKTGLGGERVARGRYEIEHVMPREWRAQWPPGGPGFAGEDDRDQIIHTLGNLTLLTKRLNSKVSNGPWPGEGGKRQHLKAHDVFFLNRGLRDDAREAWTDDHIRTRGRRLTELILEIWRVPPGHHVKNGKDVARKPKRVELVDLIAAGRLAPGMPLIPQQKMYRNRDIKLLADGRIEVDGVAYAGPSEAATAVTGRHTPGGWFFLVSLEPKRSLYSVLDEYRTAMAMDANGEDVEEGVDGEA